ncbi:hypothetical protein Tco_0917881 [Tanacetum coccineum]
MDNGRNHKFVQPNVWGWMSHSQSAYSSYHLESKVIFEGVESVTAWVAEGGRMMLCYVQGSGRRKRKKGVGCGSGRQENYGSERRDCGRIKIWDPGIKRFDIGERNVESMEVRSEFSEFSENKESVEEVVVDGGEACGVDEDELNRVILALKDGGGEFDGRLDKINLNLSEELADNGVSPIPTSLVAHESLRVRQLWERIGIGDTHRLMDNERNHKFVQPNVWGWMSDSQSAYSSYHLEGKVIFEGVGTVT